MTESDGQYREAALKILETPVAEEGEKPAEKPAEPVEAAPEGKTEEKAEEKTEEKVETQDLVEKKVLEAAKDEEPEEKPEPRPESPKRRDFRELVREKAAQRQLKEREERATQLEQKYGRLAKAIEDGDVLGLLTGAGFTHQQYVEQMLNGKKATAEQKGAEPTGANADLLKEIRELRQIVSQQQVQAQRAKMAEQAKTIAAKQEQKYPYVRAKGAELEALHFVERYFAENQELPGETFEESLEMGLEAIEAELAEQANSWEKLLTAVKKPSKNSSQGEKSPVKEAVEKPESKSGMKTLSSSLSGPAKPDTKDEDADVDALKARARALLFQK